MSFNDAMRQAAQLHRAGRLTEAISLYRQVAKAAPKVAEVHNNLAAALKAAGQQREALASYRRAVKLRPGYSIAQANLGALLVALGKAEEGLEHLATAYLDGLKRGDQSPAARDRLLASVTASMPSRAGPMVRKALDRLAADAEIEPQLLAHPGAMVLRGQTPISKTLRHLERNKSLDEKSIPKGLYEALSAPLPAMLLADTLIADPEIEILLTALRRFWLARISGEADGDLPPVDLLALAGLQVFASEWLWEASEEEFTQVDRLVSQLSETPSVDEALVCVSLYRPLGGLPDPVADALHDMAARVPDGPVKELLGRHLVEPRAEANLAAELPRLTVISDDTSRRVQAQYEANAYPRWRRLPPRTARPLADVLRDQLPGAPIKTPVADAPKILVAGCGTGRHALSTATRYAGAEVLAIDLSLASLGFAARQAKDLGIENITFGQADILGLASLDQRFDLIECSGTLHHMEDPEAGWRVLRDLLKTRGLMRISLYSARAREDVVAMRGVIAREGWPPTPDGIRKARTAWRIPVDGKVPPLTETPDFYSVSGCRDLLFHEQEVRFDPPRIARALSELELTFLGFEHPSESIRQAFRQRHPDPNALLDLTAWDQFEAENPMIFAAMYQFWCQSR